LRSVTDNIFRRDRQQQREVKTFLIQVPQKKWHDAKTKKQGGSPWLLELQQTQQQSTHRNTYQQIRLHRIRLFRDSLQALK
jgi:hypothetical protein